jgi:hypothetical protein
MHQTYGNWSAGVETKHALEALNITCENRGSSIEARQAGCLV